MPVDSHAREHVHELIERLDPGQIAAVSQLLAWWRPRKNR
jgi:hypothetical protein